MNESTEKSLGNTDINGTSKNVPDVVVFGDGDAWVLICKASSERQGWMKSTKAMEVGSGCLVQVTTQQRNPDGSYAIAEAVTFVPMGEVYRSSESSEPIVRRIGVSPFGAAGYVKP